MQKRISGRSVCSTEMKLGMLLNHPKRYPNFKLLHNHLIKYANELIIYAKIENCNFTMIFRKIFNWNDFLSTITCIIQIFNDLGTKNNQK